MRYLQYILMLCSFMMGPVCAFAQENAGENADSEDIVQENAPQIEPQDVKLPRTAKDNFAGWRFAADLFIGTGRIREYDAYGGAHYPLGEEPKYYWYPAGGLLLEIGHLWGNQAFVGPTLNVTLGFPHIIGADLRIKGAIALTSADAITMSVGYGVAWNDDAVTEYTPMEVLAEDTIPNDDKAIDDFIRMMYVPVSVGYEHVYNNGFILGASIEMRVGFKVKETHYYYRSTSSNLEEWYKERHVNWKDEVKREGVVPIVSTATVGLRLGYKF